MGWSSISVSMGVHLVKLGMVDESRRGKPRVRLMWKVVQQKKRSFICMFCVFSYIAFFLSPSFSLLTKVEGKVRKA